ncbi:MAG: AraC family transcriptional regulator [Rubrivivax sp.]
MSAIHQQLLETHIVGADTRQITVRAEQCDALAQRHIAHVGVGDAAVPYRIVRTNLSGAYLHGTVGGAGQMLLDGRWKSHRGGMASFAPSHVRHAFHAVASQRWQYCWVRYLPESERSRLGIMAPVLARCNTDALSHAIAGLVREFEHGADAATCTLWIDLIERYVDRFMDPWRNDQRLATLWHTVRDDLARPWSVRELALIAHTSDEHLRRLCQRGLGRSPMQQVSHQRIRHAAHLLATTRLKVDAIAGRVGYLNAFAFSNTFLKVTGLRPSVYRARQTVAAANPQL